MTIDWTLYCRSCRRHFMQRCVIDSARGEHLIPCPYCDVEGVHRLTGTRLGPPRPEPGTDHAIQEQDGQGLT